MVKSILLVVLSVLAATTSAQLARAPERVRDAKNNSIMKSSSNTAFGRRSSSGNLRNGRGLQQSMSMDVEVPEAESSAVEEPAHDPSTCDIAHQHDCAGGKVCKIHAGGVLCNPIVTVPYFCEGECVTPSAHWWR